MHFSLLFIFTTASWYFRVLYFNNIILCQPDTVLIRRSKYNNTVYTRTAAPATLEMLLQACHNCKQKDDFFFLLPHPSPTELAQVFLHESSWMWLKIYKGKDLTANDYNKEIKRFSKEQWGGIHRSSIFKYKTCIQINLSISTVKMHLQGSRSGKVL